MDEHTFSEPRKSLKNNFVNSRGNENLPPHSCDSFIIPGYTSMFFPVYLPAKIHMPLNSLRHPYRLLRHLPFSQGLLPLVKKNTVFATKSIRYWVVQANYSPLSHE